MKFQSIKSAIFVLSMCCSAANATIITYETRGLNEGIVAHDAKANFEAQTSVVNTVFPAEFSNIWWGYDWNKSLKSGDLAVSSGINLLEVYWAENCCNGSNSAMFSSDFSDGMQAINVANLNAVDVAEPSSLAILGLGLFALALRIRRN